MLLISLCYFTFAITDNLYLFLGLAVIVTFLHTARITSFGILVKDKSKRKNLSRNEGVMYSLMNLAWIIGPLFVGIFSKYLEIKALFVISSVMVLIALVYFRSLKIKDKKKTRVDKNVIKLFIDFFKDKDRVISYFLSGGINYWWSLIYVFMPLYIVINGLGIDVVGYFLFAVAIPLVTFTYLFSNLAGKIGFKTIFKTGYFILFIISLLCFFIPNIYLIMALLVLGSIGASMLEATTEAYFFDCLKGKQDLRFYGPYNTTIDFNHFVSRGLGGLILLILPFKFLFVFFGLSMLAFAILSFKAKNINESRRKG